jgi:hypothetical protein
MLLTEETLLLHATRKLHLDRNMCGGKMASLLVLVEEELFFHLDTCLSILSLWKTLEISLAPPKIGKKKIITLD